MFRRGVALGLGVCVLASADANAAAAVSGENADTEPHLGFEGGVLPAVEWDEGESGVAVSGRHFVWSDHSLRWDWRVAGASLTFPGRIPIEANLKAARRRLAWVHPSENHFVVWIYNKTPLPDAKLRFAFLRGGEEQCWFPFGLNFSGWRTAWVSYDSEMNGKPGGDLDAFTIGAPAGLEAGTVWIGDVVTRKFIPTGSAQPDYQVPFIKDDDGRIALARRVAAEDEAYVAEAEMPEAAIRDVEVVRARLFPPQKRRYPLAKLVAGAEARLASYSVVKDEHGVRGAHLLINAGFEAAPEALAERGREVAAYLAGLCRVGYDYRGLSADERDTAEGKRLATVYALLVEHLLDQGFAEGSSLGATHHFGYSTRHLAPALAQAPEVLERYGLRDRVASMLRWYFGSGGLAEPAATVTATDMDYLNTVLPGALVVCTVDTPKGAALRLHRFRDRLNAFLCARPARTADGIKPDGSLFHHNMHYRGYGLPGIRAAARVAAALDGTQFELSQAAYDGLKLAFLAACDWAQPWSNYVASGRWPGPVGDKDDTALLDLCRSRPGTDAIDRELAAAYLAAYGGNSVDLFGEEIEPLHRGGMRAMRFASAGIYRKGQSIVHLKGFGAGVRGHETYRGANRYGRYNSHGTVQVFKDTREHASGATLSGWDWCLQPGATTMRLTFDELEGSGGFYGWQPRQATFPSGTSALGDELGSFMFQLDLHGGKPHPQSLRMRKTVFAIGSRLVCLGSGISGISKEHPVVTTLFQQELPAADAPIIFGNEKEGIIERRGASKGEETMEGVVWLIDAYGTGYLLPDGGSLRFRSGQRGSRNPNTKAPNRGLVAAAWLDHGVSPGAASYRYDIVLDATPERMRDLAGAGGSSIRVLRQDDGAHVIACEGGVEAYACFAGYHGEDTIVTKIDPHCLVIVRSCAAGGDAVELSVTDLDLAEFGRSEDRPASTSIEVKGRLELDGTAKGVAIEAVGADSRITFPPSRGAVQLISLKVGE